MSLKNIQPFKLNFTAKGAGPTKEASPRCLSNKYTALTVMTFLRLDPFGDINEKIY